MKKNSKIQKLSPKKIRVSDINDGFTLVEILVAVVILTVGILAVSQMTVLGLKVNTVVNQRMYARVVMAEIFEELNNLPSNHANLVDPEGGVDDLADDSLGDYTTTKSNSNAHYSYNIIWNVVDNMPEVNMKTIRIFVMWGPNNTSKISSDLLKRI